MPEFDDDLRRTKASIDAARDDLLSAVDEAVGGFDTEGGGDWTVAQVLEHVIDLENQYATGIDVLRGRARTPLKPAPAPASPQAARHELELSRERVLEAFAGVDEETFYRIVELGQQGWSVLTVLEKAALHDREHAAQIRELLAGAGE